MYVITAEFLTAAAYVCITRYFFFVSQQKLTAVFWFLYGSKLRKMRFSWKSLNANQRAAIESHRWSEQLQFDDLFRDFK